ncbi:MAG: PAS domain-containing sensor histidine kinase, partial [Desulfobacteraceae bacterium]|nr:PAS domain-containing sensor histidine kinase [Desulfobacteraceae bacterium]
MSPTAQKLSSLPDEEKRRRRREFIAIVVIIPVVAVVAWVLNRNLYLRTDFPISNQILMFSLININLLLLLLLIFLVFRNLVKLLYDRKRKVMGAKLRTRLVIAFVTLTLLPSTVLFVFSISFITRSIEFWFNVPVEQALENSLQVGQTIYQRAEQEIRFLMERVAYQIDKKALLDPDKNKPLSHYLQIVQREFNLDAIEVYDAKMERQAYALSAILEDQPFERLSSGDLLKSAPNEEVHRVITGVNEGELIRIVGPVPFGVLSSEAKGFVVISSFLPWALSENMSSIKDGYEQYKQAKLLKRPIQTTSYMTLSIVALLVVFCAVWLGFY